MALQMRASRASLGVCGAADAGDELTDAVHAFLALTGFSAEALKKALASDVPEHPVGLTIEEREAGCTRISCRTMLEKSAGLVVLDLVDDAAAVPQEAAFHEGISRREALLLRGLPVLFYRSSPESGSGALTALVEGEAPQGSPMCRLSIEDAASLEGLSLAKAAPKGEAHPLYGFDYLPPGAGAVLVLSGGSARERGAAAARVLRRAGVILLRRLDIARASLAEGEALEWMQAARSACS